MITKNQEPRTKNQEPRTKNQEPRTKNQEPRTKNQELKRLIAALAFGAGLCFATSAHAALTLTLNGQGVYDTDLNLTWLRNANLAASNTFSVSGINAAGYMTWNTAQSWIGAMNTANYLGFSDWRLPTTPQPDATCSSQSPGYSGGINCTGSEMGHLFYNELGGAALNSILNSSDPDLALFQSVPSYGYWSVEYAQSTGSAWYFNMDYGNQGWVGKQALLKAWAVRDGGNPVSAVPEPETYAMLLAGLGLLGFTARRRKQGA